ncbi:hypothetical protein H206_06107 [Candidatus Electrothrix aarhusensis]|uniref:Uncharacterized protein n=1 Tax=Candidatus Electrothrix aarhusensis TaxID=1859131 RepID=A0A3S3SQA3_9BACT|nr:hypothetical protein H206_06107 [Candidatus Electrothrix aarhusensis]
MLFFEISTGISSLLFLFEKEIFFFGTLLRLNIYFTVFPK